MLWTGLDEYREEIMEIVKKARPVVTNTSPTAATPMSTGFAAA